MTAVEFLLMACSLGCSCNFSHVVVDSVWKLPGAFSYEWPGCMTIILSDSTQLYSCTTQLLCYATKPYKLPWHPIWIGNSRWGAITISDEWVKCSLPDSVRMLMKIWCIEKCHSCCHSSFIWNRHCTCKWTSPFTMSSYASMVFCNMIVLHYPPLILSKN